MGRYWNRGPQANLYVPAPLLVPGENSVAVLELEGFGDQIEIMDRPVLGAAGSFVGSF